MKKIEYLGSTFNVDSIDIDNIIRAYGTYVPEDCDHCSNFIPDYTPGWDTVTPCGQYRCAIACALARADECHEKVWEEK